MGRVAYFNVLARQRVSRADDTPEAERAKATAVANGVIETIGRDILA